jgi:hypothetical protein
MSDRSPSSPIALTDAELTQIFRSAQPLPVGDRDAFLRTVAEKLSGLTLGEGRVFQVCREVQRDFLRGNYPDLAHGSGVWTKYR